MKNENLVICWFSCGIASTIATKLAIDKYELTDIYYIDTGSEHPDNIRYLSDCEKWFDKEIHILKNSNYKNHFDVIEKTRYINGVGGARCTKELKKNVRFELEDRLKTWKYQVIGYDITEKRRAEKFKMQYPNVRAIFPLIEHGITKSECITLVRRAGIQIPKMYELGYNNNNCIGCVKGGKGYWNAIRHDFPEIFERMSGMERKLGRSCINGCFLDQLPYVEIKRVIESCSLFCDPDFMNE